MKRPFGEPFGAGREYAVTTFRRASSKRDANLSQLALQSNQLYEGEFKTRAGRMTDQWERQKRLKDDRRCLEEFERTYDQEIKELKEQNGRLKTENESLCSTLHECKRQLGSLMGLDDPKSVSEALELAEERFPDRLVIHEKARQSAEDSPYRHPRKIYYVLSLLAQYAGSRVQPARHGLAEWLQARNCPFEYAPNESELTRNNQQARSERTVQHNGVAHTLCKHIKIGKAGEANHCCRVYFELLEPDRILVWYVGRHPTTV